MSESEVPDTLPTFHVYISCHYYYWIVTIIWERTLQSSAGDEVRETRPLPSGFLRIPRHPPSYQHLSQCGAQSGQQIKGKCLILQGP